MTAIANTAQFTYWNEVAGPKWVRLSDAMEVRLQNVNARLLAGAGLRARETVLEIGCGTGAATLPIAAAIGPQGHVTGLDISAPMLAVARSRLATQGISNVTLVHGDAQAHRLAAQHFDLVISRFGVMFFADPVAAFTNLIGALRPGGRLCFVCWASLDENPYWKIPLDVVIARLGPPAPKPPHAPGPMAFSDVGYVRGILERAGFQQIAIKQESIALIGTNPDEEARYACIMGPSANLLEEREASDATREAIAEEMATAFASFVSERGMLMPATIYVVTAFRPH